VPHIPLRSDSPGIRGLLESYPETGKHLLALAQVLLRGPSSLSPGEREAIAAYVSAGNECRYCMSSHGAAARALLGERAPMVDELLAKRVDGKVDGRLSALLAIAERVRADGRSVTLEEIRAAREAGADETAIHDTVLIAAAFCMFNRYVDGLGATTPNDPAFYEATGQRLATYGYATGPDAERSHGARQGGR